MRIPIVESKFDYELHKKWLETQKPKVLLRYRSKRIAVNLVTLFLMLGVGGVFILNPLFLWPMKFFAVRPGEYLSFYGYGSLVISLLFTIRLIQIIPPKYRLSKPNNKQGLFPQINMELSSVETRRQKFFNLIGYTLIAIPLLCALSASGWVNYMNPATLMDSCNAFLSTLLVSCLCSVFIMGGFGFLSWVRRVYLLFVWLLFLVVLVIFTLVDPSLSFLESMRPIFPPLSITEPGNLSLKDAHPINMALLILAPVGIYAFWRRIHLEPKYEEMSKPSAPNQVGIHKSLIQKLSDPPAPRKWYRLYLPMMDKRILEIEATNFRTTFRLCYFLGKYPTILYCAALLLVLPALYPLSTYLSNSESHWAVIFSGPITIAIVLTPMLYVALALTPTLTGSNDLAAIKIGKGRYALLTSFYPQSYREKVQALLQKAIPKFFLSTGLLLVGLEVSFVIFEPELIPVISHHLCLLFISICLAFWCAAVPFVRIGRGAPFADMFMVYGIIAIIAIIIPLEAFYNNLSSGSAQSFGIYLYAIAYLAFPVWFSIFAIKYAPMAKGKSSSCSYDARS